MWRANHHDAKRDGRAPALYSGLRLDNAAPVTADHSVASA
jgi:hypothetical protein